MTSPRSRSPQPAASTASQASAPADRISQLLPQAGDQALMLHWLTGFLSHSPEFTAAATLYLDMEQRRQAGNPKTSLHPRAARPESPQRDDSVTIRTCPACGQPFTPSGRRRWCSDTCKQAAYRRRITPPAPAPDLPAGYPKKPVTVYECSQCGFRALGIQRCDDCGTFMPAAGIGGLCPSCDEPIAIQDLISRRNP
jgi:Zn ribbon nucleic-acid-binding protein